MSLLEVQDLKTQFETEAGIVRAVDGVSLAIERGRTLGLVGESGCGKSVTALSIMRLIPTPPGEIVGGRIQWKDRDLLKVPIGQMPQIRGREISMIFQDPMTSLNPVMTVERQMTEVLQLKFGTTRAEARRRSLEMLERVGLPDAADRMGNYPHELSGGMKQRIMIAMALLCKPDLLIADEPTTALDVTIQAQILELMRQLQEETGTAIILITHDMGVVAETCAEVAVMYAGRIVEHGNVHDVFARPRHPYTHGLLRSIPRKGLSKDQPLPTIEGVVPSLIDPPEACRFADRCPRHQERCYEEDPKLRQIAAHHDAACHFPVEAAERP